MGGLQHRFAVILAADCVHYCRDVEDNADRAVAALNQCKDVFTRSVVAHDGREFGSVGDSLMAEFLSPVQALRAARDIQARVKSTQPTESTAGPLQFRIALHEGDVIAEGDNLYGDAVNIAARLQQLARPGGIVVSSLVYEQAHKEPGLFFRSLGSHLLKNIEEPVTAYDVQSQSSSVNWRRIGFQLAKYRPAILAGIIIVSGIVAVTRYANEHSPVSPPIEVEGDEPSIIDKHPVSKTAYDLYLEARELFVSRTDLERSITLFEQALDQDEEFARAWAGLAAVYAVMPSWGFRDRDYFALAFETAQTALEFDNSLSLPYSVVGLFFAVGDPPLWEESFANFGLALQRDENNATNFLWRGNQYARLGFSDLAMSDYDRCLSINHHYGYCEATKASVHLLRGEREQGIALFLHTLERGIPGHQPLFVSALALSGNRSAALLLADQVTGQTGAPIEEWIDLIENPNLDNSDGLTALNKWLETRPRYVYIVPMALAFRAYERINYAHSREKSFLWSIWLPEFSRYRESPEFKVLVNEMNMQSYWRAHGFPPQCRPIGKDDFDCA